MPMMSARMPGNCLSRLGRVKTAAAGQRDLPGISVYCCNFQHFDQRPSSRGLDGEFWPAGEPTPSASGSTFLELHR